MRNQTYPTTQSFSRILSWMIVFLVLSQTAVAQTIMFDDFTYTSVNDAQLPVFNKWNIIDGVSGPPEGALYSKNNVSFINDPANSANRLMTLSTTVNGTSKAVTHSRIEANGFEYFQGTYAARVNFSDVPFTYKDGNVQTFYTIVSSALAGDGSRYSEIDFEYLAADKWGIAADQHVMYMTSWNRYIPDPWQAWKRYFYSQRSWAGWHTCIFSATDGVNVKFWIDGVYYGAMSTTDNDGSSVYPRNPMQVAFANWIWNNVVGSSTANRTTTMQVDWTLFYKDVEQSPAQVDALVSQYRSQGLQRRNLQGQTYVTGPCTLPSQPGTITGNTTVTSGSSQTYSIAAVSGATSYTWTLPSGWSGSSTGTSITTTAGSAGGNVVVRANNACGAGPTRSLAVTVSTCSVPAQPGTITGNTTVNAGSAQTYAISAVSGATSYTWTLPAGWSGSSTSTSINATAGSSGGTISVRANNACGSGTTRTLNVTVASSGSNIALNKSVTVSSIEAAGLEGGKAVDGNGTTRWASATSDPQWITVDLGSSYSINRVKISWEAAYGKNYEVQVSANGTSWSPIKTVTNNTALTNDWTGLSGTGRYIRMYGTVRGTAWGYSIFELEVYGTPVTGGFTTKIEAENYTFMAGVIKETCSEGGQNIGSFDTNDWMAYNVNIPTAGQYTVSYRVSSIYTGRTLRFEKDNGATLLGSITVPNTGNWQAWTTVTQTVTLPAGAYAVGLTTFTGGLNINWFEITSASGARVAPSTMLVSEKQSKPESSLFFPNPTKGIVTINGDADGLSRIQIIDRSGNITLQRQLKKDEQQVDLSTLAPGSYLIRVINVKGVQRTERVVIE